MSSRKLFNQQGFNLVEVLVGNLLAIIVLLGVGTFSYFISVRASEMTQLQSELDEIIGLDSLLSQPPICQRLLGSKTFTSGIINLPITTTGTESISFFFPKLKLESWQLREVAGHTSLAELNIRYASGKEETNTESKIWIYYEADPSTNRITRCATVPLSEIPPCTP